MTEPVELTPVPDKHRGPRNEGAVMATPAREPAGEKIANGHPRRAGDAATTGSRPSRVTETSPGRGTAQGHLADAGEPLRQILEAMNDGFMHVDHEWRITYANFSARHGQPREEIEGRTLWDAFPEVRKTEFEDRYRQAMQEKRRVFFEAYYAPTKNWMENTVLPGEGGIWVYYRDVTERHRVQELLQARNNQQATVARIGQSALSGMSTQALLDLAAREVATTLGIEYCKILELNALGDQLLLRAGVGWRAGLVGRASVPADADSQAGYTLRTDGPVVVHDLGTDSRFRGPALLLEHGVTSGMSVVIQGTGGPFGVLGAHARGRRAFSEDDINFLQSVAHVLGAAIERRTIEGELRRHRDNLEDLVAERTRRLAESNQEMEAFNYSVSHDLRTPLRAISGLSGLLVQRYGKDLAPAAQKLLVQVQQETVRMGALIEELLNLSRYHRMELRREPVDLSALAEEVLAALSESQPERHVQCIVETGIRTEGDPHLLRVVLENLLGNAWKFTQRRGDARIEFLLARASPGLTACIRDNGAGFDMAYAQKLFQPFQRLHNPSEFDGTGIGLATVARIVQRHGGTVWAEGRAQEGASFYFSLP